MKFEFRLQSSKEKKRKLIKKPKIFKLFKSRDVDKEIVTGVPVSTDLFNRTLYTTPNGNFRALGDEYNLYSNVFQGQNNFVTLAPPKEEDEEDTRPPEKPNEDIGTIIITPPPPKPLWNLCYPVWDENYKRRIYMTELPIEEDKITAVEVLNPFDERYKEEYPELENMYIGGAFGFYNNTFLMWGYPAGPTLYRVDYNGNILQKEPKYEDWQAVGSSYSIYKNRFYFAYIYGNYTSVRVDCLNEDLTVDHIWENINVGSLEYIKIWKNFVAYSERNPNKLIIFDYINNRKICELSDPELNYDFYLGNITSDVACFVAGKWENIESRKTKQFCIILNSNGTYKIIENDGISLNVDVDNSRAILYYYPYSYYADVQNISSFAEYGGKSYIATGKLLFESDDGKIWRVVRGFGFYSYNMNVASIDFASDGSLVVASDWYKPLSGDYKNKYIQSILISTDASLREFKSSLIVSDKTKNPGAKKVFFLENNTILSYSNNADDILVYISNNGGDTWIKTLDKKNYWEEFIYLGNGKFIAISTDYLFSIPGNISPRGIYSADYGVNWDSIEEPEMRCILDNDLWCKYSFADCPLCGIRCLVNDSYTPCDRWTGLRKPSDPENCAFENPRPAYGFWCLNYRRDAYFLATHQEKLYQQNSTTLYFLRDVLTWWYPHPQAYYSISYEVSKSTDGVTFYTLPTEIPKERDGEVAITIFANDNVIIASIWNNNLKVNKLYRSLDDGQSWILSIPLTNNRFNYFYNCHGNILGVTNNKIFYSDDNGASWHDIETDHTGIIEIYEKIGNTYNFKKRYEVQSPYFKPQQDMGYAYSYCKLYKNKLYIQDYIFNLTTGDFSEDFVKSAYRKQYNLFLDRFRFYARCEEIYNWSYCFYVYDLETEKEILLKPYYYPNFTLNHAMTYYLR